MVFKPSEMPMGLSRDERKARILAKTREYLPLRSTDPVAISELLAANRVKRGARWLNRNAPNRGWWRNCLNGNRSRIRTGYSGEDALEIAFEHDPRFTEHGYSFSPYIIPEFDLYGKTSRYGFSVFVSNPFPRQYPDVSITSEMVDAAWEYYLTHPTGEMITKYRHPTALDREFEALDFTLPRISLRQRIMGMFRRVPASSA